MKKVFLILTVLVSLVLTSCSSSDGGTEPEVFQTFYKTYDDYAIFAEAYPTSDGYVTMGSKKEQKEIKFNFVKLNKNGEIVSEKEYIYQSDEASAKFKQVGDNRFAFVCYNGSLKNSKLDVVIIDSNFNIIAEKSHDFITNDALEIISTSDGKLIAVGFNYLEMKRYMYKIDSNGDLEWKTAIDAGNIYFDELTTCEALDGYLMINSYFDNGNISIISKISIDGSVEWTKELNDYEVFTAAISNDNNSYALVGFRGTTDSTDLIKLDSDGNFLSSKEIDYGYAHSIIQSNDGGYLFAMQIYSNFNLVKIDEDGNIIWAKGIDGGIMPPKKINNTGYIVSGFVGYYYYSTAFFMVVNNNGEYEE